MKVNRILSLSSKRHVVVLALLLCVVIALGGYISYFYQSKSLYQQKHNELHSIGKLKANQISSWLKERNADVNVFKNSSFFIEGVDELLHNSSDDNLEKKLFNRMKAVKEGFGYADIIIADINYKIKLSTSKELSHLDQATIEKLKEAILREKTILSDFYYCKSEKKIHFDFIAPLFNADRTAIALMIFRVDPYQHLYPVIQSWPIPSKTGENVLVKIEEDGVLILNDLRLKKGMALTFRFSYSDTLAPSVQAVSGTIGVVEGVDYRGVEVLADVHKIVGTNWRLVSKIDKDEIFAELYTQFYTIFGISLGLILVIATSLMLLYNYRQKTIYRELYSREKELWQFQEKFKVTLDSVGDGIITTNLDGKIEYMNRLAETLTGWSFRDARGRLLNDVYIIKAETTGEIEKNPVEKVLEHGIVKYLANHTILISKSGKEIPIMDTGAPMYDHDGKVIGVVLAFQDETEKRMQKKLLSESEQRYRNLIENSLVGVYSSTTSGEILYANSALLNILEFDSLEQFKLEPAILRYKNPEKRTELINSLKEFGRVEDFEIEVITHKGKNIFIIINAKLNGNVLSGMVIDINEKKKSELQREEAFSKLKLASVSGKFALWNWNMTDNTLEWSELIDDMLGYQPNEFPRTLEAWEKMIHPDDHDVVMDKLNAHLESKIPYDNEYRVVKKDGSIAWWRDLGSAIFDEQGKPTSMAGACADITPRKLAEAELRKSEARFRSTLDNMLEGCQIIRKDFRYIYVNDAAASHGRTTKENLVGKKMMDVYPGIDETDFFKIIERCMIEDYSTHLENEFTFPDGSKGWFELSIQSIPEGVLILSQEITKRKVAEALLRENEQKYRTLIETSRDAIFINLNNKIIFINSAGLELFAAESEDEVLGKSPFDFFHPDYHEQIRDRIKNIRIDKFAPLVEEKIINLKGEVIDVEVVGIPFKLNDQMAAQVVLKDITARKKIEAEILQSKNFLENVLNTTPSAVYTVDLNQNFTSWNKVAETLTGYTTEEVIGKNCNLLASDTCKEGCRLFDDNYPKPGGYSECTVTKKDGTQIIVLKNIDILYDANGTVIGGIESFIDITDRKLAEEQILQSQKRLKEAERIARLGHWELDFKNNNLTWSDEIFNIFEIDKHRFDASYERFLETIHPDDRESVDKVFNDSLKNRTPYLIVHRLLMKDGRVKYVEEQCETEYAEDGSPIRAVGTVQDITTSKLNELKIREDALHIERLNRLLTMMSNVNQLIVREKDDKKVLSEACRIAVQDGKFTLAWVAVPAENNQDITIAAANGSAVNYLNELVLDSNAEGNDKGITVECLVTQKDVICNGVETSSLMMKYKEHALKHNIHSCGSFPIFVFGKLFGAISFYADVENYFAEEEIKLLDELALDIGFAIETNEVERLKSLAEEKLKESNERFNRLVSELNDVVWTASINDSQIFDVNNSFEKVYGIPIDEFIKNPKLWIETVHPDDKKIAEASHNELLKEGKSLAEYRIVRPDGKVIWLQDRKSLIYDENNVPIQMGGIAKDITLRKQSEQMLLAQRDLGFYLSTTSILEEALKYSMDSLLSISGFDCGGFYLLDENNSLILTYSRGLSDTFVNETSFFPHDSRNAEIVRVGEPIYYDYDKVPEQLQSGELEDILRYLAIIPLVYGTKSIGSINLASHKKIELSEIQKEGLESLSTQISNAVARIRVEEEIHAHKENLEQLVDQRTAALLERESELKKAKEEAENANRAKSVFLANMSHEIRTPMNAIIGFSDMLFSSIQDEKNKRRVDAIRKSGKNLLSLINDILDLSKIEAEKLRLEPEPVNIISLAEEVETMFLQKISEKHLNFMIETESEIPDLLLLDGLRLKQVLFNLIGNALKFTEHGHVILIVDKLDRGENLIDLILSVEDTGIGVPEDEREYIFEAFAQQKEQSAKKFGGTGLGLAISKRLIEIMGGTIELNSKVGEGSTFKIILPSIQIVEGEIRMKPENLFDPSATIFEQGKILIVDDNQTNRTLLIDLLEHSSVNIFQAVNGKDAIDLAVKELPDVILMDLRMPVMDGIEATKFLKGDERTKDIPVICISASSKIMLKDPESLDLFDEYLLKPVDMVALVELLKKYLKHTSKDVITKGKKKEEVIQFSEEQLSVLPELVKILNEEYMGRYETVSKSNLINEIEKFGNDLKVLGERFTNNLLADHGKRIAEHASMFEIDKLNSEINKFKPMVNFLSEKLKV